MQWTILDKRVCRRAWKTLHGMGHLGQIEHEPFEFCSKVCDGVQAIWFSLNLNVKEAKD